MKRKCCFCIAVWFTGRPLNVFFNQSLSHGSIHSSCFNLGVVAPVGPVHFPNEWKVISLMSTQLKHSVHSSNSFLRYDASHKPLTLSGGQLQLHEAHQSCLRSGFCGGVLHLSGPPRSHLYQSQSSTSSLPPSPQRCPGAFSDQESENKQEIETATRIYKTGQIFFLCLW